jgi:hypothetical protein
MMIVTQNTKRDVVPGFNFPVEFHDDRPPPVEEGDPIPQIIKDGLAVPEILRYFERYTPNDSKDHDEWKSFEHYKAASGTVTLPGKLLFALTAPFGPPDYVAPYCASSEPYVQYDGYYGIAGLLNEGLSSLYTEMADGHFVSPPVDLDNLKQRSLSSMLPIIKAELSLINSIIELKDFHSLPKTLNLLASLKLPAIVRRQPLRKALRSYYKSAKETSRAVADSYLQAKFNILPLLSDISGIKTALSRTERRMNDFITRSGRVQHKHFAHVLQEGPSSSYDTHEAAGGYTVAGRQLSSGFIEERFTYPSPTMFHAEIEYNYNYTRYQIEHARLLSLLDAVGVNFNPVIIWNAIPWSFVVDWVVGVNQWLSKQRIGFMDPKINIHRYLWSVKRHRRVIVQRKSQYSYLGLGGPPYVTSSTVPLPAIEETAYRRDVSLPEAASFVTSGLSPEEFSLAAALVIARRSTPLRRKSWAFSYEFPG